MSDTDARPSWSVHKFGGTSLANAERYRRASALVRDAADAERNAVVVSAMSGITDQLLSLLDLAGRSDRNWPRALTSLKAHHHETIQALLGSGEAHDELGDAIERGAAELAHVLEVCALVGNVPGPAHDLAVGYGELWSAQILCAHLRDAGVSATWLDARDVLVVRPRDTAPAVEWSQSQRRLDAWLTERPETVVVVTGFVARTPDGVPTTLRRNGSDFTASIFGRLLDAGSITIWTDVDGVMSAHPGRVPEAFPLDRLSYDEAIELAYFGAKVLHPQTMTPAIHREIPIRIRNSGNAKAPGTLIGPAERGTAAASPARAVRGLSTVDDVALINLEGTGMIGVPGIAERLFSALRNVGVSVVMISQASSEHSICFAVPGDQAELAQQTVTEAFFAERTRGHIDEVSVTRPCTLLAAVGDAMAETPGVASRLFRSLASARINIRAVAQGASERNITVVVDERESSRALRAVHTGFYLSEQTLSIGVIGTGVVGRELVAQLAAQAPILARDRGIDLRVKAIARSREMALAAERIDLQAWLEGGDSQAETLPTNLEDLVRFLHDDELPHRVLIDCTASSAVAANYRDWMELGFHVVTPNKLAGTAPMDQTRALHDTARRLRRHFLYETTVGAGLPIITTVRDLIRTGDRVHRIDGVLSGTLSSLFNTWDGERPFSQLLDEAREAGFTEPAPRDDLSGMDVARKLIILAREIGLSIELDDVDVESLIPGALVDEADPQAFCKRMADHDDDIAARYRAARSEGKRLRYIGRVEAAADGKATARVSLQAVPEDNPFAALVGSDNLVAFTTDRYDPQPLIVRGPGAGPAVTAGGVFADLLRLASFLGAPS